MANVADMITKAKAGLVLDNPFFASIVLRLKVVEAKDDPMCPTACTDGKRMIYNPDWMGKWNLDNIKGILAHEAMHVAMAHMCRRQDRHMGKWNAAADYAVNNILLSCGFHLPDDVLKGMFSLDESAESIYNKLPDNKKCKGGGGGGKGQEQGGAIDYDSPDPGNCGGIMDAPGANGGKATQSEMEQAEQENKIMVAQAAQAARMMGKLPGALERFVTELLEPKVLWTNVLREFVNSNAKNDYSWFPPNRRHIYRNIFLPSIRNEELGEVVVMVDTSGSIGNDDLKQFASEMTAILEAYDATCTVIYCDADVAGTQVFTRMDLPLILEAKGGGGTDFRPPFKWLEQENLVPKCCIYLTDLECNQFPPEPEFPVLWAKIGKWGCEPPFGMVIEMDKE